MLSEAFVGILSSISIRAALNATRDGITKALWHTQELMLLLEFELNAAQILKGNYDGFAEEYTADLLLLQTSTTEHTYTGAATQTPPPLCGEAAIQAGETDTATQSIPP